jgi:hypothetical protein
MLDFTSLKKPGTWLCCLVPLILMHAPLAHSGEAASRAAAGVSEAPTVIRVLNNRTMALPLVGFGAQYNQDLYSDISSDYGITPENVGDLEQKVIKLGCQHVRIFYDPDAPTFVTRLGKVSDPNWASFRKVVHLAQRSGATVNITYWHGGYKVPASANPTTGVYEIPEMATFAKVLKSLRDEGLTCVQYVTVQNEPNTDEAIDKELYGKLWRSLDHECRKLGVRPQLKFVGGDLIYDATWGNYSKLCREWLEFMGARLSDVLDGYSVHVYWNAWQYPMGLTCMTNAVRYVNNLPAGQQKPLYITEFGMRGYRGNDKAVGNPYFIDPGADAPHDPKAHAITDTLLNGFYHATFCFEAVRNGYVALVRWDAYRARYDGTQNKTVTHGRGEGQDYSMIRKASESYSLRPSYYQLMLMTHCSIPGSRVLQTENSNNQAHALALEAPDGRLSVFIYPTSLQSTGTRNTGLPPGKYWISTWNENGHGTISQKGPVTIRSGEEIAIKLPPQSFAAVTSFKPL